MKIAFRSDASIQIGTGHVMRCLTLADALAAQGAHCEFICRAHAGHLMDFIRSKGFTVHPLPVEGATDSHLAHSEWLGATQTQDAADCTPVLSHLKPDWLVVDHYALDTGWESLLSGTCGHIMAIDDLADRAHNCQLLLDQTIGRSPDDYRHHVPSTCQMLCGSDYALLRPEFVAKRPYSLHRRTPHQLRQLLINLGGVDKDNVTAQVLTALRSCPLPADCEISVVMGTAAPWLADVRLHAQTMPWPTTVHVGVNHMAQLMADSDLAIGAAGATSWERCCLGLPTIMLVLAENQRRIAKGLSDAGAAILLDVHALHLCNPATVPIPEATIMRQISHAAATVVDGLGTSRVVASMINKANDAN